MAEVWASGRAEDELMDRTGWQRDNPNRRPRQADKRRAWCRELLAEEIRAVLRPGVTAEGIRAVVERLLPGRMRVRSIAE